MAAIDTRRGIADDHGIPWQGKIPGDTKYYRGKVATGDAAVMGYGLYKELSGPYPGVINYVASSQDVDLRPGFELVKDARQLLQTYRGEIWDLGGAGLFASTIDLADELYLTQLDQDFNCTKLFPEFKDDFKLQSESQPHTENGITYTFQVWVRK